MSNASHAFRCRAFPQRTAGVLLHLTALTGNGPVGSAGAHARHFIDFLAAAGFTWWQVCPLGPTGYGDSPYQTLSVFAGNPYLLDLANLEARGLLNAEEVKAAGRIGQGHTDYGRLWNELRPLLKHVALRGSVALAKDHAFQLFKQQHATWLLPWMRYSALREQNQFTAPATWKVAKPDVELMTEAAVLQFLFHEQWLALKKYAHQKGVKLLGDEPIYVSADGCDMWAHPELFQLDRNLKPVAVAGVPPDYFSEDGQLWGNPLYDWNRHAQNNFSWWRSRVHHDLNLFDAVRIDHFRGIHDYWSVPADAPNARHGRWEQGPGIDFTQALGDLPLVAEDLGLLSPGVDMLRQAAGLPGMSVLQFGFSNPTDNPHHPSQITPDRVAYSGTHDNDTVQGWLDHASENEKRNLAESLGTFTNGPVAIARAALESPAICAIIAAQDLLGLGSEARFNTPGKAQGNWTWRMSDAHMASLFAQAPLWREMLIQSQRTNASVGGI